MSKENLTDTFMGIRNAIASVVRGIVPPAEIEDIVQETYVKACQAEAVGEIRTPRSFLYKTARNLAIDHMKKAETRLTICDTDADDLIQEMSGYGDQTVNKVCSDEEFAFFCDAVRNLPTECRKTFVLKKVYGYSQKEIAEELNLSQSTVEKHVAQGIKRCTYYMMQKKSPEKFAQTKEKNTNNVSSLVGGRYE